MAGRRRMGAGGVRPVRDRRIRLALLFSGLRWRARSSLAMFVVAVLGVGIGVFGPVYLHSADQAILGNTLAQAPAGDTGLTLQAQSGNGSLTQLLAAASKVPRPAGRGHGWFLAPLLTEQAGATAHSGPQPYSVTLVSRTDVCAQLSFVSGGCPSKAGTISISTRSASLLGTSVGRRITLSFRGTRRSASLEVVGLYVPGNPANPYWWGENPFSFGTGGPGTPLLDDAFTSAATLAAVAPGRLVSNMVQLPYRQGSLAVGSVGNFETLLTGYQQRFSSSEGLSVSTQLPQLLSQAALDEHTTTTIVAVVDLQLVLLALFVLYFISSRTAAEREPDVRLAENRGFRPRSTLGVALTEPVAIVIAAVPVGLVAAWLVASASARLLFGAGIGTSVDLLAAGAAVLTGIAGIGATALGARRMIATAEASLAPGAAGSAPRHATWALMADVAVVAIAGAAFVELSIAGVSSATGAYRDDPLAALSPGLLALAFGILGARLLAPVLRSTFRFTAFSKKVSLALATRRVARRRELAPQVVLVAMAAGLVGFGVSGWAVASRNRDVQSEFGVGAAKVLLVSVRPGVDFLQAVRTADPSGHSAMAVVVENASDGTTLAVDSSRMKQVMYWPSGLGSKAVEQVARELVPGGLAPEIVLSGESVRVTLDATVEARPSPQIALDLFDQGYQTPEQLVLGVLRPGLATYEGSLAGLCPVGCRLADLAVSWAPPAATAANQCQSNNPFVVCPNQSAVEPSGSVKLVITSMSERSSGRGWKQVPANLDDVSRWTVPSGGARLYATGSGGLGAIVKLIPDGSVSVAPADVPNELPAVVTPSSTIGPAQAGSLSLVGLDGGTISGVSVEQVPALPRVGPQADLVDLGMAERLMSGPFVYDTTEVWLSESAPAGIVSRLESLGVSVTGEDSAVAHEQAAVHGPVSLAYELFLLAAMAAGVLAVGATAVAVAAAARRRQGELAAMHAVGLAAGSLRRALRLEQALVLGTGVVLGGAAGLVAAAVSLKSIPEFVSLGAGPPLELGLPILLLVVAFGAVVVGLCLVVLLGTSFVVKGATVEKLNESESW